METYWILSQNGEKMSSRFTPLPCEEASAAAPEEDLCPRSQIRRLKNEDLGVNMGRA